MGWEEYEKGTVLPQSSHDFAEALLAGGKCAWHEIAVEPIISRMPKDRDLDMTIDMEEIETLESRLKSRQDALDVKPYIKKAFEVLKPTSDSLSSILRQEAEKSIGKLVWKRKDKIADYVAQFLEDRLKDAIGQWEKSRSEHEAKEDEIFKKTALDNDMKVRLANIFFDLSGANLENSFEHVFTCMPTLPYATTIRYTFDEANGLLNLSIDLPGIDIIPTEKEYTHSRGTSVKDKLVREVNYDYAKFITGLAYHIASPCFNTAERVKKIFVIGVSKQFSVETASIKSSCLYSVLFDREAFEWVTKDLRFMPFENFAFFPHAFSASKTYVMQEVEPFYIIEPYGRPKGATPFMRTDVQATPSFDFQLDERFDEAAKLVVVRQQAATSLLQRLMGIGFSKAGRIMEQLEAWGIVGPQDGAKPRQVLVSSLDELDEILKAIR